MSALLAKQALSAPVGLAIDLHVINVATRLMAGNIITIIAWQNTGLVSPIEKLCMR